MKGVTASSLGVLALSLCLAVLPGCNSTAVKAPVITSFTANPTVITAGGSASLTGVFADGTGLITPGKITIASPEIPSTAK